MADFLGITAVTPWEAALKCYEQTGRTDPVGTTYKVISKDGVMEKFILNENQEVVPADLFPVM